MLDNEGSNLLPLFHTWGITVPRLLVSISLFPFRFKTASLFTPFPLNMPHSFTHLLDSDLVKMCSFTLTSILSSLSRSKVRVRVRAEDQGRIITCEADNGLGVTVATNITLDVLREYLPPFVTNLFTHFFKRLSRVCVTCPLPLRTRITAHT